MLKTCEEKISKTKNDPLAGFLFINKESGWTSHDVVAKLRGILGVKKIGHAGTLDPLATGLLIIGIGKATTLLDYWHQFPKTYIAEMEFGKISDTFDSEGEIENINNKEIEKTELEEKIKLFLGKQIQTPPPFSAKKIKGKKAYELARKGQEVKLEPKEIEIFNIELIGFDKNLATLATTCSTGTYIRSLINDIGLKTGYGALMTKLKRTAIGPIKVQQAKIISDISQQNFNKYLLKPEKLPK